jgi:type IV secretory pathway TraG/TraD family ATPase VirD4
VLKKLFSKFALAQSTKQAAKLDPLNQILWRWSKHDPHTVRDSVANWIAFGATGAGKSTGPSAFIAMQHLSAGFGGMFASVKPGDMREQLTWCRQTGRSEDVIVFGPGLPWRFNFLDYELQRGGAAAGTTENIMQVLLSVLELRERRSGSSGGGENAEFFENAKKQILRATIDVLVMAKQRITVSDIYKMITSAPTSVAMADSPAWRKSSFCFQSLVEADQRETNPSRREDLRLSTHYWLREIAAMSDRTRTSITSTVTGAIDLLQRGFLRDLLCTTTNVTPNDIAAGKVLIFSLSQKEGGEAATILQFIMKYAIQTGLERRDLNQYPNPCFLHLDEFASLFTFYDSIFATTGRSSRTSFGLLAQNLPVLYHALGGGDKAKAAVEGLLGNMNLKILCANSCTTTNQAMSDMIGRNRQYLINSNASGDADDYFSVLCGQGSSHSSTGISEAVEHEIPAQSFTQLRPGGPPDFVVDTILFRAGRPFQLTGRNWMPVTFNQQ